MDTVKISPGNLGMVRCSLNPQTCVNVHMWAEQTRRRITALSLTITQAAIMPVWATENQVTS